MNPPQFGAVVLAGERPGGGKLARELGLPAGVLAPLAGQTCLGRVLATLGAAQRVAGGVICGPERSVVADCAELQALLTAPGFRWVAPANGPAASALAGVRALASHPLLLTAGDHGLLEPGVVDAFCTAAASRQNLDLVVGLVPHPLVAEAFPESRRTVLTFSDGTFCGSNLFALLTSSSERALTFWSSVEADRKRPWRIARRLGPATLLRYVSKRLAVGELFEALSERAGCRIGWVEVPTPRAAVDVDSRADWQLANRLLSEDAARASQARASNV